MKEHEALQRLQEATPGTVEYYQALSDLSRATEAQQLAWAAEADRLESQHQAHRAARGGRNDGFTGD
jgi:hypothetical protein